MALPLEPGKPAREAWVPMEGPDGTLGSIRVKLHTVDELLLPRARYAALQELLTFEVHVAGSGGSGGSGNGGGSITKTTVGGGGGNGDSDGVSVFGAAVTDCTAADPAAALVVSSGASDSASGGSTFSADAVLQALQHVTPSSERPALCKTLLRCTGTYSYLYAACRLEIAATAKENVLFRGNSLASCSIDLFMKLHTIERSSYLENTLSEAIQAIYDSKQSCEVDPMRIANADKDPGKVAASDNSPPCWCSLTLEL